jgi:lysozyme family protein
MMATVIRTGAPTTAALGERAATYIIYALAAAQGAHLVKLTNATGFARTLRRRPASVSALYRMFVTAVNPSAIVRYTATAITLPSPKKPAMSEPRSPERA